LQKIIYKAFYGESDILNFLIDIEVNQVRFIKNAIFILAAFFVSSYSFAGCVFGAKDKTSYVVLDNHTLILKGGYGRDILIKSFSFFYTTSEVTVLKDSFCSYDNSVLYVNGELVDANSVEWIN